MLLRTEPCWPWRILTHTVTVASVPQLSPTSTPSPLRLPLKPRHASQSPRQLVKTWVAGPNQENSNSVSLGVYVFKDVGHGFLTRGCVEVIAMDGRTDAQRGGHDGGLVALLCFHRCGDLREFCSRALQRVCSKIIPGLLFKVWTKAPGSNYTGDIRVISRKNNHRQV